MRFAIVLLALCSSMSPLLGAIVTVPIDLEPGDGYRLVFLTSKTNRNGGGNFISLIRDVPQLDALDTSWTRIGTSAATGTDPQKSIGVPIYRLDGVRIADNNAGLWSGSILAPIKVYENGGRPTGSPDVFTGIDQFGNSYPSPRGFMRYGWAGASGYTWANAGSKDTGRTARYYVMSDIIHVPGGAAAVPEPSSLAMVGLLVIGFFGRRVLLLSRRAPSA